MQVVIGDTLACYMPILRDDVLYRPIEYISHHWVRKFTNRFDLRDFTSSGFLVKG